MLPESTNVNPLPTGKVRRQPDSLGRVACRRLGSVVIDRCRECVYLVSLEDGAAGGSAAAYVVCSQDESGPEAADFEW